MIRDTDAATFGIDIGLAEGFLDGAQVSTVQLKAFIAKAIVTSKSICGSSKQDPSSSVVGADRTGVLCAVSRLVVVRPVGADPVRCVYSRPGASPQAGYITYNCWLQHVCGGA
jgi:hypothetical protein